MARRDRGLTPAEQDAYLQWLAERDSRAALMAECENSWRRLDVLRHWRPAHSGHPNPDLLAVRRPRRATWWRATLAAAAVLTLAALMGWQAWRFVSDRGAQIVPGPERLVLDDGSLVELQAGARVTVRYTAQVRRVHLESGEAHFTVAKNPDRPFVVEAGGYAVRAVGTAFLVQRGSGEVAVLVTEGRVRMSTGPVEAGSAATAPAGDRFLVDLTAGQLAKAVREASSASPKVSVRDLTPLEIDAALEWRGIRLEFDDLPLREVVKAFNRYNTRQLVIADPATAEIRVGGNFRADNLGAFVRLLDSGFGVSAEERDDAVVLRRR
jgi:transmembrane sensor